MASQPTEAAIFSLTSKPGIRRDGTDLDNTFYQDAQWVRFQRGRPRKMGGYRLISDLLSAPIRAVYVDSRAAANSAHVFSPTGVEKLEFDNNGVGGGVAVRTPSGFVANPNYTWSVDAMFQSGGGGAPVLLAAATPDLASIADDATGRVYSGPITGSSALTTVQDGSGDIQVSGGLVVLQPFLFVFGSNGLIRNSNPNDFSVATGWSGGAGLANTANVAGSKIVRGLPLRGGGQAPAGIFWSLDSLIRVSFVGGTVLWKYDTISAATSVLSKAGIIEADGVYFWVGVDRFFTYNGVVQELPNDMNQNFFFDNLNFAQRQKVYAKRNTRYGEIWWFFPSGASTECDKAVIYNYRENTWYDAEIVRSAGASAQVFPKPILAGGDARSTTFLSYTAGVGVFASGQTVTGGTSGATGMIVRLLVGAMNVWVVSGAFVNGETISSGGTTGTVNAAPAEQELNSLWQHETGTDRVYKQDVTAIEAYFETTNFQFMSGGPAAEAPAGANMQTRITRIEPDFIQSGDMELFINGSSYAKEAKVLSPAYSFTPDTKFIDLREMRRELSVKFRSNVVGGDFQMGRCFATVEAGDVRG